MPPATRRKPKIGQGTLVWQVRPYRELYNSLDLVRKIAVPERPLGCIIGPAGTGKTFTAESYQANNVDVAIVTVPPKDVLTARMLMERFLSAIGGHPGGQNSCAGVYRAIVEALADRDWFIVVDEADRLRPSNADLLREIAEESSRPLCYLGCDPLKGVLDRVEATHHRCGVHHYVEALSLDELQATLVGKPLDEPDAYLVRKWPEDAVATLWDVTGGNLRHIASLIDALRKAHKTGSAEGVPLEDRVIRSLNGAWNRGKKLAA